MNFECRTPNGGTGGTGGGAGGAGSGGTGGAPGGCAEMAIPGEAQLTGQTSGDMGVISVGGDLKVTVPVDADTQNVGALLLGFDGISFAGEVDASTVGAETVVLTLPSSPGALPGEYYVELALFPDSSNSQTFTLYSLLPPLSGQETTYRRTVFEDQVPGGATASDCIVIRVRLE